MLSEVCYVSTPTSIATIANNYGPVIGTLKRLPEAICCCLQTCNVDVVLMYCIYILSLVLQLWVYLYLLPEAICCCLQTCNVYGTWVTLYCICVQIFMVTCANISKL